MRDCCYVIFCLHVCAYSSSFLCFTATVHLAFPHKQAAAVYEALACSNSSGKEDLILKECRRDEVIKLVVRNALKAMVQLSDVEDTATGLKRLQDTEQKRLQGTGQRAVTEHNIDKEVSSKALAPMLQVAKRFPELIQKDDSFSISSNEVVDIDINDELPDEEALFLYAMEVAFEVAKKRGLDTEEFDLKAREIFKGKPTFQQTFNRVVPADFEPLLLNSHSGGTQYSDIMDNIHAAASNACDRWCKVAEKTSEETDNLFLALFKG